MTAPHPRRNAAGFTLIEMVISAALMAVILVSAYLCLRAGFLSQKLVESRTDIFQSARVAMAMMSADLRSACPLSKEFEFLGMHRMLGTVEADNLDFATHNYVPRRLREGDFCEVSYFVENDRESGTASLWRRRNPVIALKPLSGGSREEIARGLRGLKFEYYDGYEWYDEWGDATGRRQERDSSFKPDNLAGMPEAVRITLWLDPNPRSATAALSDKDTNEPPLIFQTVARLNLADRPQRGSSTGSSTNGVPDTTGGGGEGARTGPGS
ncbi:MAG: prepilin-type N-terminal cleavage/methylation domain-containing protein [Limisphaerales bacterium]